MGGTYSSPIKFVNSNTKESKEWEDLKHRGNLNTNSQRFKRQQEDYSLGLGALYPYNSKYRGGVDWDW